MSRGHIPNHGEVRSKGYGQPTRPDSSQEETIRLFWFVFSIIGMIIVYWAIEKAFQDDYVGVFVLCIYLMFGLMFWFAGKDTQNIETIASDANPNKTDPALAEDYLKQIDWQINHRHSRYDARIWNYQPVRKIGGGSGHGWLGVIGMILGILLAAIIITGISMAFRSNSNIFAGILIVSGIVILFGYLIRQELKD